MGTRAMEHSPAGMKLDLIQGRATAGPVDLLVLLVRPDETEAAVQDLVAEFGEGIHRALLDLSADSNTVAAYPSGSFARRLLFVRWDPATWPGIGETLRIAAANGASAAASVRAETVAIRVPIIEDLTAEAVCSCLVEGFKLAAYRFLAHKSERPAFVAPQSLSLLMLHGWGPEAEKGMRRGEILADATALARDLGNWSPGELTATRLAQWAVERLGPAGVTATVLDKAAIEKEGMGGLLAVNRGSLQPPTFTVLEWKPADAVNARPLVLVGKGVVFDTGGLSLKSTKDSMDQMKFDMAGAATVIGAMEAVARLRVPLHVVGLLPATDNRPGGDAYVPGEVVRMHAGLTVEVLNTDAEGRMILADALSYARRFDPELVVDVATLTGAQVVALGSHAAAFMTNEVGDHQERWRRFEASGHETGDRVAALPMYPAYAEALKSDVADLKNVGGRDAGAITAAKFLERFTSYPWVHLDIAGPAYLDKPAGYRGRGATGFGVRLLTHVLEKLAQK